MTHYRRVHCCSAITFAIGYLALDIASEAPSADLWLLLALALLATSTIVFWSRLTLGAPRWIFHLLLLAATANLLHQGYTLVRAGAAEQEAMTVLAQYLLILHLLKLFESRAPRDLAQAIALSAMGAGAAVLQSVTFQLALILVVYGASLLLTVLAYHVYAGQHRVLAASLGRTPEFEDLPGAPPRRPWRLERDLAAITGAMAAAIVPIAIVIFLIMPRGLGEEVLGRFEAPDVAASADFRDQVQLGGATSIVSESRDIVLTMERLVRGEPTREGERTQYLRGAVLDDYDLDAHVWKRSDERADRDTHSNAIVQQGRNRISADLLAPKQGDVEQRIVLRDPTTRHLFALWYPEDVGTGEPTRVSVYRNELDGVVKLGEDPSKTVRYVAISDPDRSFGIDELPDVDDDFATGPIADYAQQILEDTGLSRDRSAPVTPADELILRRFETHFRDEFTYTLELPAPPIDADPIEWFLTQARRGHCEYFASAMVALCRAVGIRAHVVTGFAASEYDDTQDAYVVRKRHAHAWVEAPLLRGAAGDDNDQRIIWREFDPTPPATRRALNAEPTGPIAWLRSVYERAESFWIMRVVSFDEERQLDMAESTAAMAGMQTLAREMNSEPGRAIRQALRTITVVSTTFVGVALLWIAARQTYRGIVDAVARARERRGDRRLVPAFYPRAERLLARAGHARPSHVPPLDHARSLGAVSPDLADAAERLVSLYYLARYRGERLDDDQLASADRLLDRLRGAVHALRRRDRP